MKGRRYAIVAKYVLPRHTFIYYCFFLQELHHVSSCFVCYLESWNNLPAHVRNICWVWYNLNPYYCMHISHVYSHCLRIWENQFIPPYFFLCSPYGFFFLFYLFQALKSWRIWWIAETCSITALLQYDKVIKMKYK